MSAVLNLNIDNDLKYHDLLLCYKRDLYTRGRISGIRVSQLPEIQPFFILGGDQWINKRGNYLIT